MIGFTPFSTAPQVIEGTEENDTLFVFTFGDTEVNAGAGNDFISSRLNSNDTINAGAGDDFIEAGDGDDVIDAGSGVDIVFGGSGADTFVFSQEGAGSAGPDLTQIGDFSDEDVLLFEAGVNGVNSFGDLDTNGDGVLNGEDQNILEVDDGTAIVIVTGEGSDADQLVIANLDGIPELTADNFLIV